MKGGFRLRSPKKPKPRKESVEVKQTLRYFNTLRARGVHIGKNDEFPHPEDLPTPGRELALDFVGLCKHQHGRHIEIEMKRRSDYEYLVRHYDELRKYYGPSERKTHLRIQIQRAELVNAYGGFAMFACHWTQVQQAFVEEGIDRAAQFSSGGASHSIRSDFPDRPDQVGQDLRGEDPPLDSTIADQQQRKEGAHESEKEDREEEGHRPGHEVQQSEDRDQSKT